jgi:hypothetical protein
MNLKRNLTRKRLVVGVAGLFTVMAVAAAPVMAATATSSPSTVASTAFGCLAQHLAAKLNPSVSSLRAVGDCEIDRRLTTLGNLQTSVDNAAALTSADRSALTTILTNSKSGLGTLKGKIDADSTVASLRTDINSISADYRVYALVSRQVNLGRSDDQIAATATRLTSAASEIQTAITTGQNAGKNEAAAAARLAAMQAAISAAQAQVNGQAALVLALTPAQWNAGTATPVLNADRGAVATARGDLRAAGADARAAVRALK